MRPDSCSKKEGMAEEMKLVWYPPVSHTGTGMVTVTRMCNKLESG